MNGLTLKNSLSYLLRPTPAQRPTRRRKLFQQRPLLEALEGRALLTASGLTEFPTTILNPTDLVVGGDGNFWVLGTDDSGNSEFTVVAPDGTVKASYPVPTPDAGATTPTLGPDGNIWFVEPNADQIGKVTPGGVVTEYAIPNATGGNAPVDLNSPGAAPGVVAWPTSIVAGADGALWFTESSSDAIGRITTDGTITQTPTPGLQPDSIALGPDHALWFTDDSTGDTIDRLNADGSVSKFPLANDLAFPTGLTTGPDGALWFAESGTDDVGRITTDGAVTETPIRGDLVSPQHLAFDPAGNLWVTGSNGGLARISTQGITTIVGQQPGAGGSTSGVVLGPDGAIWFTDTTSNQIGRVDPASVSNLATDHPLSAGPEWANGSYVFGSLTFNDSLGSFYDGNPAGVASDFTAQIQWGDGSTSAGTVATIGPGQFSVTGTHDFASYATYNATVTITDVNPAHTPAPNTLTVSTTITTSDQTLVLPPLPIFGGVGVGVGAPGGTTAGSAGGTTTLLSGGSSAPTTAQKAQAASVPTAAEFLYAGDIAKWLLMTHPQPQTAHHAVVAVAAKPRHHAAVVLAAKHPKRAVVAPVKLSHHAIAVHAKTPPKHASKLGHKAR